MSAYVLNSVDIWWAFSSFEFEISAAVTFTLVFAQEIQQNITIMKLVDAAWRG